MPVHCKLIKGKWRLVEPDSKVATNPNGKAKDGGGHSTKLQCQRQARAINMRPTNMSRAQVMRQVNLTVDECAPVEIIYAGTFHLADRNRVLEMTPEMVDQMVANFKAMDGPDRIVVNVNHNSDAATLGEARAAGWLQDLFAQRHEVDGAERYSLMGVPKWTDDAAEAIDKGQFKYLSAEVIFNATNTLTGEQVGCRLVGVALTNIPAIPRLTPVCLTQQDRELELLLTIEQLADHSLFEQLDIVAEAFFKTFVESNVERYMLKDCYPTYLIVDVDSGTKRQLYKVAYTLKEDDVTFVPRGEWVAVERVYQEVPAANTSEVVPISNHAANSGKPEEELTMDETKVRELLGLSADQDLAAALAALNARPTQEQLDALQKELEELKAQVAAREETLKRKDDDDLTKLTARAEAFERRAEELTQEVRSLKAERTKREAQDRINLALRQGKVNPKELESQDGFLRTMAEEDPQTFDKLMATRDAHPEMFRELGTDQDKPKATIDELFRLIAERQSADPSLSTAAARQLVFAERPDLEELTRKEA